MRIIQTTLLVMSLSIGSCAHAATMQHGGHGAHGEMQRPMAWSSAPMLKTRMSGENRETMVVTVVPQNIVASGIDAWSNNLKDEEAHRLLPLEMAGAKLDKPASGGFQWLAAREVRADQVRVASTVYYFGERGARNPTAMFMQQKHELEILPQPYPREHSRYRANEDWRFLVRFKGEPLANQKVGMETSNGSKTESMTDAQGMLNIHVPEDFKTGEEGDKAAGHSHGRQTADFVLATEYADGGKTYLTAFNSSYGPDAFDKRSLMLGLGFTMLGMLGAVPLLRKRKNGQKSEEIDHA